MKRNKILNKISALALVAMLSILSSITVFASEPETELEPRQDISKNLSTGEVTVNETLATLNKNSNGVMESFIPEGMNVETTTREVRSR